MSNDSRKLRKTKLFVERKESSFLELDAILSRRAELKFVECVNFCCWAWLKYAVTLKENPLNVTWFWWAWLKSLLTLIKNSLNVKTILLLEFCTIWLSISIIFKVIHHIQHEHSRHSYSTHRKLVKFNKHLDHIQSHALYSTNYGSQMLHNLRIQIWSHSRISITFNNHLKSQQIPICFALLTM